MDSVYRVESAPKRSNTVYLPAELLDLTGKDRDIWFQFGAISRPVRAERTRHRAIGLPAHLMERLRIPDDLAYRIRGGRRQIRLGPVIGILAGKTHGDLSGARIHALSNHLLTAPDKGGLFYVFAAGAVDLAGKRVRGYRLLPGPDAVWEEAEFPIPQVIFRRYGASLGRSAIPMRAMGVRCFNERTLHKGEAARWMNEDPRLSAHLPETVDLSGVASVLHMLERHDSVFVKPVWGSQARGIFRVRRGAAGFEVEEPGSEAVRCPDRESLSAAVALRLPLKGIVQEGIWLAKVAGRPVDFRVILQKDSRGYWTVTGVVARCGQSYRPVTNISAGGFPLKVDEALSLLFGPLPQVVFRRRQELARLALAVGEALDRTGLLMGDLGVDIAYDSGGKPWIIEANNRDPNHTIELDNGDWPGFLQSRSMPMEFACHLAGFGPGQEVRRW